MASTDDYAAHDALCTALNTVAALEARGAYSGQAWRTLEAAREAFRIAGENNRLPDGYTAYYQLEAASLRFRAATA